MFGIWPALSFFVVQTFAAEKDSSPRYTIDATVDVEQKTIRAQEEVTFTNPTQKPLKEIFFHIYPNRKYTNEEKKFIFRYGSYFKVNPFPEGFQSGKMEIRFVRADQQIETLREKDSP